MIIPRGEWLTIDELATSMGMDTATLSHILIQKNKGFKFKKYYCSHCHYPTDVPTSICDRCSASMKDE